MNRLIRKVKETKITLVHAVALAVVVAIVVRSKPITINVYRSYTPEHLYLISK